MHVLRRVSASSGAAAPLGCVTLFEIWRFTVFSLCAQYFLRVRGGGGITTLGVLHMLSNPRCPLVKTTNLLFP